MSDKSFYKAVSHLVIKSIFYLKTVVSNPLFTLGQREPYAKIDMRVI